MMIKVSFRDFLLSHQIDLNRFRENCADPKHTIPSHTSYEELVQSLDYPEEIIDAGFTWSLAVYQPSNITWRDLSHCWEDLICDYEEQDIEYEVDWKLHLPQIFTKAPA